mmetsp:Transcript_3474/g.7207  ORF Transcript_3474/g.7207 Transcript_3474/m.7207 type:complete len:337 (+) Transcript_3474:736-1746(+)
MENSKNKPKESTMWQQRYLGSRVFFEPRKAALVFLLGSILFFSLAGGLWDAASSLVEYSKRYDNKGDCDKPHGTCTVTIDVEEDMDEPIYFYYEMRDFYQNHIVFVKSRDYPQLRGESRSKSDLTNCGDYTEMGDMFSDEELRRMGYDGNEDDVASPCGLSAMYYPNETFTIYGSDNETIKFHDSSIAWDLDVDYVYKEADDKNPWIDVEDNQRFMTWMKTAPNHNFRKLWGVIEQDLDEGDYEVIVTNAFDVSEWDGEKHIVLATTSRFGGKSFALAILMFIGGSISFVASIALIIIHFNMKCKVKPGHNRKNSGTKEVISTERVNDETALHTNF